MATEEQRAEVNAGLAQVLADLGGRPLSPALVTSYWLVMTNLLLTQYSVKQEDLLSLYPIAIGLRVTVFPAKTTLN